MEHGRTRGVVVRSWVWDEVGEIYHEDHYLGAKRMMMMTMLCCRQCSMKVAVLMTLN